jgi:hypothetical protein
MSEKQTMQSDERYEPPQVERVLTPEDLLREVHYAGVDSEQGGG